jgi:hypothetical protein
MKWRKAVTARLDVTLSRTEGSLAVAQGLVVTVYGLHLVEARSTIYVVHILFVTSVDQVIAVASVDLVIACSGVDLVVSPASPEVIIATITLEEVLPWTTI